ncbi:putative helix-turn-helix-domain containing protein, AraC type [Mycobacteroides abscessus MAB_030201_1075]|uniref:Putative helix-turn-helix-domain containing protein, AraC type n=1 Tax=Mycobacteroides abscessus MAB_030201_1075 TaxID=1335410 RepID=A0A829PBQ1_9MYCO|nr:putative helix-turn-helix-domain containing protein, AraC type [Mycobacteroides abscessus MAB_030201_1075]
MPRMYRSVDLSPILKGMVWTGAAVIEPGRLVYRGALGDTHRHTHAAVQIAIALDGTLQLTDGADRRVSTRAAVIPAGAQHTVHGGTSTGLMIYLEPTCFEGPRSRRAVRQCRTRRRHRLVRRRIRTQ